MSKHFTLINAFFVIITTAIITLTPLNGVTQIAISDKYAHLLTPAGFTFSIWGLIYMSWLLLGFKQSFQKTIKDKEETVFLNISMLGTLFWLIFWHFNLIFLSCVMMVFILLPLIYNFFSGIKDKILLFTSNLFFARGTVALLENVSCLAVNIRLSSGFDNFFIIWSILIISLGLIINIFLSLKKHSILNLLVFIWALIGICIEQANMTIRIVCITGILIIIIYIFTSYIFTSQPKETIKKIQQISLPKKGDKKKKKKKQ